MVTEARAVAVRRVGVPRPALTPLARLGLLTGAAAVSLLLFVFYDVVGSWSYAIPHRLESAGAMVVAGSAVGIATLVFGTVTRNRILTPGIVGFDALFILVGTVLVFAVGSSALAGNAELRFVVESSLMIAFAVGLYRWLLRRTGGDLFAFLLVGIVLSILFGSLTSLLFRLIDPNEFLTLQDRLFASFAIVDRELLLLTSLVVGLGAAAAWRMRHGLDVLMLGRDSAVSLGLAYPRTVDRSLLLVAVMVSVATALVGPISFLGLIAVNIALRLMGSWQHRYLLPASVLVAVVTLVGGQFVLDRILDMDTVIVVAVNMVGGLLLLGLLLREGRR